MHLKLHRELEFSEILAFVTGLPYVSERTASALAPLSLLGSQSPRGDFSGAKVVAYQPSDAQFKELRKQKRTLGVLIAHHKVMSTVIGNDMSDLCKLSVFL